MTQTARSGDDPVDGSTPDRWLSPGVAAVGTASFFSDVGHEITTSLLPTFVTSTLHAGPAALGAIEGVSDALIGSASWPAGRCPSIRTGGLGWPPGDTSERRWRRPRSVWR